LRVTANLPSLPTFVTLMMEALRSSKMSVDTRVARRNIPEEVILHSHRRGNLKSYILSNYLENIFRRKYTIILNVVDEYIWRIFIFNLKLFIALLAAQNMNNKI
jgi:hypothetical protein